MLTKVIVFVALTTAAVAQTPQTPPNATPSTPTFHVSSIHQWTPADPPPSSRAFSWVVVTGTVGNLRYTTEQMMSWGTHKLAVGTDYPVVKTDKYGITVLYGKDKKGHDDTEFLNVVGTEEISQK